MEKYYAILNVTANSDLSEIKRSYRKAVHMYHPDANGGVGDPEKFKEVVKAYQYLCKNHKTLGIKPARAKKGIFRSFAEHVVSPFSRKPSSPATTHANYAKKAARPGKRVRADEFADIDPLILQLSFEELKLRFTESENDFVKRQSARALTCLFGAGALPLLRQGLEKGGEAVGEEVLNCLGLIGDREAVHLIEQYIRHPRVKMACAAVKALQNINQGHARTLLDRIENEGRAMRLAIFHLFETFKARKLIRSGGIGRSEMYIVRYLCTHTRQPMPVIFKELGFVVTE